jgi:diaminopimelate epimerase
VRKQKLCEKQIIQVSTSGGIIVLQHLENDMVEVDMGEPNFEPDQIPFIADQRSQQYALEVDGEQLTIGAVSMGNPHAVLQVADSDMAPVEKFGPLIEHHPRFPERTNTGFMQIISPGEIKLRVYERGAGETLACGSGACAAVAVGRQLGLLGEEVVTHLRGGDLVIKWTSQGRNVLMRGPAQNVYEGAIEL